jgi:hypothetical protein
MAYGVNAPFGLRPLSSISGGSWTEKVNEYYIYADSTGQTTYGISIFTGDLVVLSASLATVNTIQLYLPTYTQNNAGAGANTFAQTTPVLGVFMGCEYTSVVNGTNNLIKSAFWPAATQVVPGSVIKAYVLDDPDVVFDIQISTPINATAGGIFPGGLVPGVSTAPIFPFSGGGTVAQTAGIGSNYSIMGGGGVNFNTIASPYGGNYTNNPTSTMTPVANTNAITVFGTNPYGGSTLTGQSGAYLCVNTAGVNATNTFTGAGSFNVANDYDNTVQTLPLKVIGYTRHPQNVAAPGLTLQTTPFLNVSVVINNHVYRNGTVGQTFGA